MVMQSPNLNLVEDTNLDYISQVCNEQYDQTDDC